MDESIVILLCCVDLAISNYCIDVCLVSNVIELDGTLLVVLQEPQNENLRNSNDFNNLSYSRSSTE